jgi:hypothetical protein
MKKFRIFLLVFFVALVVGNNFFRWEDLHSNNNSVVKIDKWANQGWIVTFAGGIEEFAISPGYNELSGGGKQRELAWEERVRIDNLVFLLGVVILIVYGLSFISFKKLTRQSKVLNDK